MKLLSIDIIKEKFKPSKNKRDLKVKELEYRLLLELRDKLEETLRENDRVLLEVSPNVVSEFINILNDRILSMYEFEQVDKNKFIFYSREITI